MKFLLLFVLCAPAFAKLAPSDRALVVITSLTEQIPEKYRAIYEFSAKFSVDEARKRVGGLYREIDSLRERDATLDGLARLLGDLAARKEIQAIDVLVHLHGSPGGLLFWDAWHGMDDVSQRLSADVRLKGKVRALYSTACYGTTHGPGWLAAGFRSVSGARKVNANTLYDYPTFLKAWGGGRAFAEAQELGNDLHWRTVFDRLAKGWGFGDADSYKEVHGDKKLTIETL